MATVIIKAPWHHRLIAALALLFYGVGAIDYALSRLGFGFYLSQFSEESRMFLRTMPLWLSVIWALGIWGGLGGAWLLWSRSRWSVPLLFVGAAGIAFMTVWMTLFTRPTIFAMAGVAGFYFMVGSSAIAVLFYLYARWERSERMLA